MPELLVCPQCNGSLPASGLGGLCPACLLQLGLQGTERPADTSDPDRTVDHPDRSLVTTAPGGDLAGQATTDSGRGRSIAPESPVEGRLGGYDLLEELGRGGMGVVYKAVQRVADRVVAVKVLPGWAAADRVYAERFAAEVRALARVQHPSVIPVYEVGESDGRPYFSMEFAPGGTLSGRLKQGPVPPAEAAGIVAKLAAGVESAHRLGVLHRDIKPGNVLIAADGTPRLADFGLAKWTDREDGLTKTGAVMGTPSYMAPEQAAGSGQAALDARTDVYALGATLYELLTGRPPFRGRDSLDTLKKVVGEEPVRPRSLRPGVAAELEAVCLKCLEKDPTRRYQTAQELADDLDRWLNGESTVARPLSQWRTAKRWLGRHRIKVGIISLIPVVALAAAVSDPVWRMKAQLQAGYPVTLVGLSRPNYQRWVIGTGTTEDPKGESPFLVFSQGSGYLELLPDPQTDHFRLSAEWQVDSATSTRSLSGLYFAHSSFQGGPENSIDQVVVVQFDQLDANAPTKEPSPKNTDDASVVSRTITRQSGRSIQAQGTTLALLEVNERKGLLAQPWRKMVVDVTPELIQAQWQQPDGSMTPLAPVKVDILRKANLGYARSLLEQNPWVDPGALDYRPRGGLGLFVRDARVFFRNVVLEPLPVTP